MCFEMALHVLLAILGLKGATYRCGEISFYEVCEVSDLCGIGI